MKTLNTLLCLLLLLPGFSACRADTKTQTGEKNPGKGDTVDKLAEMNTPIFWAEGHPGALDREGWKIEVTGLCDSPRVFTWQELNALPQSEADGRLTSVTRWSVRGIWKGVALSTLLKEVGMQPSCKFIRFWSVGMKYDTSIPLDVALMEKSLLAHSFDGYHLSEDYGGPVRAFIPYLWGYKSAKSVVKVELMDRYVPGYWEKRGYTDSAEIEAGPCVDVNAGGERKIIEGPGEVKF